MGWSESGRVGRRGESVRLALLSMLGLAVTGCAEGPFLQTEEYVTKPGELEVYTGGSCFSPDKGSASGGATAPGTFGSAGEAAASLGYSYGYEGRGKAVRFSLSDYDGRLLAERNYDAAFLESGRKDVVNLQIFGQNLRFVHRGVAKCGELREPAVD
jgi:hypothetical protein